MLPDCLSDLNQHKLSPVWSDVCHHRPHWWCAAAGKKKKASGTLQERPSTTGQPGVGHYNWEERETTQQQQKMIQPSHLHVTSALSPLPPHCLASLSGPFTQHPLSKPWLSSPRGLEDSGSQHEELWTYAFSLSFQEPSPRAAVLLHSPRAEHQLSRTSQHPRADVPVLHRYSQHPSVGQVVASVTCVFTLRVCTLLSLTMACLF